MRQTIMTLTAAGLLASCASLASGPAEPSVAFADDWSGRVLIAGDSTAADYPIERAPQIGWGQVIDYYLATGTEVVNRAVNGRSTKSYIDEGRWADLLAEIEPGDLVLISFGHNDSRDDAPERYGAPEGAYRDNLIGFARDVEARGATPVILSSVARRLWEGPAMVETHGPYRENAQIAASEAGALFIDLSQLSLDYFETLGRTETKDDFLWLSGDEVRELLPAYAERYPDGLEDNTHFREVGACGVARIIALELHSAYQIANPASFQTETGDEAGRPADVISCAGEAWN